MLKRAFSYIIGAEKQVARDYERWSRSQLIQRIKELESKADTDKDESKENTPASDIVSTPAPEITTGDNAVASTKKTNKKKTFDFSTQNQRFIALRFAYTGWNYSGLAFQNEPTPLPTVEEEILKALTTAKLIAAPDPHCCDFSRCGRTDKGVSALNQVISLKVRSRLSKEDQEIKENDVNEIPYVTVLNTLLPLDIKVTAVCLRPPEDFDARFSCDYRHYKYIFKKDGLDLELMQQAAAKYVGPHDFRNFCKIDGSKQITNYGRTVLSSSIQHLRDDYYVFDLKGTAFLWHQVRCMVAILFLIGQKLELIDIIDKLVDVTTMPSKPIYDLANDIPLVLYDCVFPEMEWVEGIDKSKASKIIRDNANVKGLVTDFQIKTMITEMVADLALRDETGYKNLSGSGVINTGDGRGRNFRKYVKIVNREYGDTFEVVNAKHREKKRRKLESNESINE